MSYAEQYLQEASEIIQRLDQRAIEQVAVRLAQIRADGGGFSFWEWAGVPATARMP
jgi:hypothetical protein